MSNQGFYMLKYSVAIWIRKLSEIPAPSIRRSNQNPIDAVTLLISLGYMETETNNQLDLSKNDEKGKWEGEKGIRFSLTLMFAQRWQYIQPTNVSVR